MGYIYECNFDMDECIKALGLDEKGRVQQFVSNEVLKLCEPYVPLDEGGLKDSGRVEDATDVVWGGETVLYAHYQWEGIVYEDPELHCAGFRLEDGGWRSRKNVEKVPTERKLTYENGGLRGPKWVERMLQNGGMEKIEKGAKEKIRK